MSRRQAEPAEQEHPLDAIAELADALGVRSIKDLPGCWEFAVDAVWWFALNGHGAPCRCSHGTTVPPYTALVEYNGWPAGLVDPADGTFAAGEGANVARFIAACRARREGVQRDEQSGRE